MGIPDIHRSDPGCVSLLEKGWKYGADPQHFPIEIINHIECSETLTREQGITHEIDRPGLIGLFQHDQGDRRSSGQSFLGLDADIELHFAIDTPNMCVFNLISLIADHSRHLFSSPTWMISSQFSSLTFDDCIIRIGVLLVKHDPVKLDHPTSPSNCNFVHINDILCQLAFLGDQESFFR